MNQIDNEVSTRLDKLSGEERGPVYNSSTHGPLSINGMDTKHIKNAASKKLRGHFKNLPPEVQEVISLLLKGCNQLSPGEYCKILWQCCDAIGAEDNEFNSLLKELMFRA